MRKLDAYIPGESLVYRTGYETYWRHARPLSDPNIIQLRPHTPGDPMPCSGDTKVMVRIKGGRLLTGDADEWDWKCDPHGSSVDIVAWAPLP